MGAIKKAHLGAAGRDSSCGNQGQWTPLLLQDFQCHTEPEPLAWPRQLSPETSSC